jgi:transcriptional regulator with XRE-family HTH domain
MFLTPMPSLNPVDQTLAAVIRRLRDARNETQEQVAFGAGLTLSAFGRIERGQISPSWTTVRDLAQALDVSLEELGCLVESKER